MLGWDIEREKNCLKMEEECLEQNLLDHSNEYHDEISCVGEGSTYTNCSFVINNEIEANNNIRSSSNKPENDILPKTPHSCVRFKGVCDATPGGRPPDLLQALISADKNPVKFELGDDSSAALQPGKL